MIGCKLAALLSYIGFFLSPDLQHEHSGISTLLYLACRPEGFEASRPLRAMALGPSASTPEETIPPGRQPRESGVGRSSPGTSPAPVVMQAPPAASALGPSPALSPSTPAPDHASSLPVLTSHLIGLLIDLNSSGRPQTAPPVRSVVLLPVASPGRGVSDPLENHPSGGKPRPAAEGSKPPSRRQATLPWSFTPAALSSRNLPVPGIHSGGSAGPRDSPHGGPEWFKERGQGGAQADTQEGAHVGAQGGVGRGTLGFRVSISDSEGALDGSPGGAQHPRGAGEDPGVSMSPLERSPFAGEPGEAQEAASDITLTGDAAGGWEELEIGIGICGYCEG